VNEGTIPFVQYPSNLAFAASGGGGTNWGNRWFTNPGGEMRAVGGISWRTAAIFCNWLHNGRGRTRDAFMSGVYDVSTFGWSASNPQQFTDQLTASAGAIYRLPTLDEWLASVHYDPSGNVAPDGSTSPRWWLGPARNDLGLPAGQPWAGGQTSGGRPVNFLGGGDRIAIPLGAYADVQTPWGLLDASGGTSEWMDTYGEAVDGIRARYTDGSRWFESAVDDLVDVSGGDFPNMPDVGYGVRIVMVPSPSAVGVGALGLLALGKRRRVS
jgi:formylglycine-generating enzyme required for sulfatase activity